MTTAPPPPPPDDEPSGTPGAGSSGDAGSTGGFPPPPPPPPPAEPAPGGYGDPPPTYGAPPPQGYGAPPPGYGAPAPGYAGAPMQGSAPSYQYANWGQRVGSALIDYVAPFIVAYVIYLINKPLGVIVYLVAIAWAFYMAYQGGATGQSFGKKQLGLRLVGEQTGQNIGGGMGIGRYLLHILDGIPCYIGYLWPLWDSKRQTFADKIVKTVVIKA